jgi:hypothetical protein
VNDYELFGPSVENAESLFFRSELLKRSGVRAKSTKDKPTYSFTQRWEDRAWIIRAWVELQLLEHDLGGRGEYEIGALVGFER